MKKRFYIVLVSRDQNGTLKKVPIPLHYAYIFAVAAIIGIFTITGLAGSYSRMLLKTAKFNQMRQERESLRKDYANLEKVNREKDVQAASLGSLASEVSALYGLTTSKLALSSLARNGKPAKAGKSAAVQATAELSAGSGSSSFSNASYHRSIDDFYTLRANAFNGGAARAISGGFVTRGVSGFDSFSITGDLSSLGNAPSLWPVIGPITSAFGQREDPILGAGEGEFHKGVDISSPYGTPIHATGAGIIESAAMGNGYGREVVIDHGNGLRTIYAHMSSFSVVTGQQVVQGQVVGYVGTSGRSTGPHVHYEVRIRNIAVNPHKYLRTTLAGLGSPVHSGN